MKDEFLVTLLTSSGEKQCLQRFRNVVMCFNKALKECNTVVKTQCWNLRGASAKNNADDVRESLDNSDLVICVIDPTATEGVREDVVQALDWVRESFQMSFFAVKERNMFIYVKQTSASGTGSKQAQRAMSFLETLYKKDYNPITYPSENAFALTLLYQLCNMVRSELWWRYFPRESDFGMGDIFTAEGLGWFGINFLDLNWVKNCKEHQELRNEIEELRNTLKIKNGVGVDKYAVALRLTQAQFIKEKIEREMLQSYCLLCRFFSRQNTPEMAQAISAFLSGDITLANKKLNTTQLVRRISAYRKNPAGLKSAGVTYKNEFDYLLNCYLLKIHLLLFTDPLTKTDAEEQLYRDVLSLSQGLVTFVEQMGINDEAGDFFYDRSEISQAKAQFESSVRMFEAFPREKQKKTSVLGISAYHLTACCLEKELGDVKMIEGENLPKKTLSALKAVRVLYHKALSLVTPLLKRYPNSYWEPFAVVYSDLYGFYVTTGQIARADKLSEETHLMVSKLDSTDQSVQENTSDDKPENKQGDVSEREEFNKDSNFKSNNHKSKRYDFVKLLDKCECHIEMNYGLLERAQKRIPQGLGSYIKALSKEPDKVEEDLFSWIDSEEALPDIFSILKWSSADDYVDVEEPSKKAEYPEGIVENTEGATSSSEKDALSLIEPEEYDIYNNWDIAEILLDQATIFSKEENYIQAIRYGAAALESLNKRLIKKPTFAPLVKGAINLLEDSYYAIRHITEGFECSLHKFSFVFSSRNDLKIDYSQLKEHVTYYYPTLLWEIPEEEYGLLSPILLGNVRDFIMEHYLLLDTERVLWILKAWLRFFKKIGSTEQIEKTESDIRKTQLILESQKNINGGKGGLFGNDF